MVVQVLTVRQGSARCAIQRTERYWQECTLAGETGKRNSCAETGQVAADEWLSARGNSTPFFRLCPRAQARLHDDHHLPSIYIYYFRYMKPYDGHKNMAAPKNSLRSLLTWWGPCDTNLFVSCTYTNHCHHVTLCEKFSKFGFQCHTQYEWTLSVCTTDVLTWQVCFWGATCGTPIAFNCACHMASCYG